MNSAGFEDRECCPDDLCTGIIGEDGKCGVCGRSREGLPLEKKPLPRAADVAVSAGSEETVEEPGEKGGDSKVQQADFDPEKRIPCSDELCTGIIGENGRCGVCGRTPEEASGSLEGND